MKIRGKIFYFYLINLQDNNKLKLNDSFEYVRVS